MQSNAVRSLSTVGGRFDDMIEDKTVHETITTTQKNNIEIETQVVIIYRLKIFNYCNNQNGRGHGNQESGVRTKFKIIYNNQKNRRRPR